jgi:hypothetical protein
MVDLAAIPEAARLEAQRCAEVIRPLLEAEHRPWPLIRLASPRVEVHFDNSLQPTLKTDI